MSRLSRRVDIWGPVIIGTAAFILLTGGRIIFPSNIGWLMMGDSAEHFMGWQFFRSTPMFQWPIGANPNLGIGLGNSIVFTDSIPIAAMFFKLINSILPTTFQYFGLWIWSCFVLQAVFGWKLLANFITNRFHLAIGATYFAISPVFLYRLVHDGYGHIALASQWLIIASLHLYFKPKLARRRWIILCILSSLIQPYFIPMILAIASATFIKHFISGSISFIRAVCEIAAVVLTTILTLWISGYFAISLDHKLMESWNFVFRWQPLSIVDPSSGFSLGWSRILADLPQLDGDQEAFSFLGTGILSLALITLCIKIYNWYKAHDSFHERLGFFLFSSSLLTILAFSLDHGSSLKKLLAYIAAMSAFGVAYSRTGGHSLTCENDVRMKATAAPLFACVSIMAVYSMTNQLGIGRRTIISYPIIGPIKYIFEVFRTHGRFIWPLYYLILLFVYLEAAKWIRTNLVTLLLIASLAFQIFDSQQSLSGITARFTENSSWQSPMVDARWGQFINRYQVLIVLPPLNNDQAGRWIPIADFASKNHMATNSGNFDERVGAGNQTTSKLLLANLENSITNSNYLYLIEDQQLWASLPPLPDVRFVGELDGYKVIAP